MFCQVARTNKKANKTKTKKSGGGLKGGGGGGGGGRGGIFLVRELGKKKHLSKSTSLRVWKCKSQHEIFSPVHPSSFFPFLCVVWIKKVTFYKRQLHSCVWVTTDQENNGLTSFYSNLEVTLSFIVVISFPHNNQIELWKLELARITTAKNENKVSHHKENW